MMECGIKNIVFSSSATVYGHPKYLPLDESHPTGACTNPYGKTKYFTEEIMKDVCAATPVSEETGQVWVLTLHSYLCTVLLG